MDIVLFRLVTAGALPVIFAALFYSLEKRPGWQALPYALRQTLIGFGYGLLAVLGTEFGIPVDGAVLNVRNAAPLTAGMLFGWPAGIIAGAIGGLERWLATLWGVGAFTRLACTLATFLAGLIGAGVRVWLLDDRKPGWFHGLALGVVTEVLHMLMVFLTNTADIQRAFFVVQKCALPMITANGISVMLAALVVNLMSEHRLRPKGEVRRISQTFQRWLFICVAAAFAVTLIFTARFQTRLSIADTENVLRQSLQDVQDDIHFASDTALLDLAVQLSREVPNNMDNDSLRDLAATYRVTEINLVDNNGIIVASTNPVFEGYNMNSGTQSAEFLCLLNGSESYVQRYQPIAADHTVQRKYAGVATDNGFVQVGYDAMLFQQEINQQVRYAAQNRHIGQNGYLLICDSQGVIVSDNGEHTGETIAVLGHDAARSFPEDTLFQATIHGVECYCMHAPTEGYAILAVLPATEAMFFRDAAVYILAFMETLVFAALFTYIFFLIKRLIVNNIHRINRSLDQITQGDLNVTVDVRTNQEFASLSDDINTTVDALRRLIGEAEARIDRELEVARQIQHSALPSVFPNRSEFDIFACMHAAKEVGGDFYDFYMADEHTLVATIADVSDKGIPAAMFMMQAKALLKSSTEGGMALEEAFNNANQRLLEGNDTHMFVTVWSISIDLRTGEATIANAGHNPPVLCRPGQPAAYHKTRPGLVMAASGRIRYRQTPLQLQPGDLLFLYTDGITEATNAQQELYGEKRLLALLDTLSHLAPEEICHRVKADVDAFVGDAPQFDDMTMLALRYRGGAET